MIWRAIKYYFSQSSGRRKPSFDCDTTPVADVDWQAYLGRWYELARFETPFEFGLADVYAEYAALEDGKISIRNCGTDAVGKLYEAQAQAVVAGGGQLRVSFVPFFNFISSLYRVLYVDADYEYALVSNESGSCLWLLARQPQVAQNVVDELLSAAQARGFDVRSLIFNHALKGQVACPQ